jgi:aryl-alcohol dehydrogenase-like predicted oxidoreductase
MSMKALKGTNSITRRNFIAKSTMVSAGIVIGNHLSGSNVRASNFNTTSSVSSKRKLGSLEVSSLGLGCMSMAGTYNPPQSKVEMVKVIRSAYDKGVTFFDTAEVYGPLLSEEIVGEALQPLKGKVVIASKFGFDVTGGRRGGRNSKPAHIKEAVNGMLTRLKVETIDLCYLHRLDPEVPIEEVAGTVKELIAAGKIRHFGLSEVSPETIRRAHAVQKVSALQSEYSLVERVVESKILDTCEELGIGFVCWGPTNRGFLTGRFNENSTFDATDRRSSVPYFTPDALKANMPILDLAKDWAKRKGITPAQFSLAWLMAQKPWIVPIPGTTNIQHVEENIGADVVKLTADDLKQVRESLAKIQVKGVRAPETVLVDQ